MPHWLDLPHKRLDEAVFAAYGWKSDMSDEEILEKLLAFGSLRFASGVHASHKFGEEQVQVTVTMKLIARKNNKMICNKAGPTARLFVVEWIYENL